MFDGRKQKVEKDRIFAKVDEIVRKEREENFANPYRTIDDLPLSPEQKKCVLEWFAWKITEVASAKNLFVGMKHYDPLMIDDEEAHSYVFDFEDGGRHHKYRDLKHLEKMLMEELLFLSSITSTEEEK